MSPLRTEKDRATVKAFLFLIHVGPGWIHFKHNSNKKKNSNKMCSTLWNTDVLQHMHYDNKLNKASLLEKLFKLVVQLATFEIELNLSITATQGTSKEVAVGGRWPLYKCNDVEGQSSTGHFNFFFYTKCAFAWSFMIISVKGMQ